MAVPSAFAWKDLELVLFGNIVVEIKELTYQKRVAKQNNYGRGKKPVSRSRGNEEYEGSMKLALSESNLIRQAAGVGKDETDIAPTDAPVVYLSDDQVIVKHLLKDLEFTATAGGGAQGDLEMVVDLPFICSGIDFNVQ